MSKCEREIQREIVAALRTIGCVVLVTSTYKSARNTRGTPDLFVFNDGAGFNRRGWIGLECKSGTGPLTAEQKRLVYAGMVTVVRSAEDALKAVR